MANKGYRHDALVAAKDLRYGEQVIKAIREAKTEAEIIQIMCRARNGIGKQATRRKEKCLHQDFLAWAVL